jgi:hypothetical protein
LAGYLNLERRIRMADTPIDVKGNFDGITISLPTGVGDAARELKAKPAGKPLRVVVTTEIIGEVILPLGGGGGWTIKIEEVPWSAPPVPNP